RQERRTRPSRQSRGRHERASGRKEKVKSAAPASARAAAAGAERWGGSAGTNRLPSRIPRMGGEWRDRKRRRNGGAETTRWKQEQAAKAQEDLLQDLVGEVGLRRRRGAADPARRRRHRGEARDERMERPVRSTGPAS
ncbi:unnamed protein product, partial [Urochloa humidicola]